MPSTENEAARRDLVQWSQPIVSDLLRNSYAQAVGRHEYKTIHALASSHGQFWRLLLRNRSAELNEARREILAQARLANIESAVVDTIDRAVLDELLDVIMARFIRTPSVARTYCHFVVEAATGLATCRMVAV